MSDRHFDVLVPSKVSRYKSVLCDVMTFMHGRDPPYGKEKEFTDEELIELQPTTIVGWMCLKVYGTSQPSATDLPSKGRSSSLEYYKKALSWYMPNKLQAWDVMSGRGNPTRSINVNQLIKVVKKREVRQEGKASSADRAFERDEFNQIIDMLASRQDIK